MSAGITSEQNQKKLIQGFVPLEMKERERESTSPKKIILLAGPTACGKTTLSLMLAEALSGEIVSADSMQVYRGMDIGTAKISEEEQARIPHYLIDIRHLQETFNVVDFYYEAKQCCDSILARGKVPIVVGGSGFYFRTLLYGPPQGPPSLPDLRQDLENEMEQIQAEKMFHRLKELDPIYAASITCNDKQKIVRALEIMILTGEKVSKFSWENRSLIPDYDFHCWFLYRPRKELYKRIDERCDYMLDAGFLEEVRGLEKKGLRFNSSASQAIGYRQALDYLQTPQTEVDYQIFVQEFKKASRHYAKRQFTWFRKEPLFQWLNIEVHDFEIAVDMIIQEFLAAD